ncbi:LON peptidase substrate-binding domain-containing protein [uncultured Gimesia sp.]|mgnify:CR=1 FL=1|uniref:LON peptidase substrate-binding domain-containing protein n=1 Tax=uncultured Gimesia sp. TaxID=1678688 RepID=UPI0026057347|nr:LON peptidase substrate-binding domain-containing protein [uncultured Gimesia sp.]
MTVFSDLIEQELPAFSGIVPVLELEDRVLLPHSILSLRMTAAADCQLIADAISDNALVAVTLKQTSIDTGYEVRQAAAIGSVCLASIVAPYQLQSGDYSILLRGICRARSVVIQESDCPYQKALLELNPDFYADQPVIHREHRQLELLEHYARNFLDNSSDPTYYHLLHREISLGKLCDTLADTINLQPALSRLILEEHDVDLRSDLLLNFLKNKLREQQCNPLGHAISTEFSQN